MSYRNFFNHAGLRLGLQRKMQGEGKTPAEIRKALASFDANHKPNAKGAK
jgi:hypothetical protein